MHTGSLPGTEAHHTRAPRPAPAGSHLQSVLFAEANAALYAKSIRLVGRYWRKFGRLPNIAVPRRYSERMLWRKVVDHNPLFVCFSDKLAAKEYVRQRCPDLPIPRTLWIGGDADAIPEALLRGDVFVKASHGCNFNLRLRGGPCDRDDLRRRTRRWLRSCFGRKDGQWAYSGVTPRLFVEEAVGDVETAASSLTVTGASSNTGLVPVANIVFGGSASNRTVTVTPATNAIGKAETAGDRGSATLEADAGAADE